ncbi:hypothetical protein F1559_001524 [Cyanidiococcus yangmingshanensis]|uniref:RNB domain-containing protein n=1 Tax=Cyanidiococcus yangmingshanensis TaxID=2690220 RepID=A0A7J7IGC1_9RHOD|nr:hypothetical protein F1559_001524 [Cyanidiococcus yangmingshanensis]
MKPILAANLFRLWVGDIDLDAEMSLIRHKFAVPSMTASAWATPCNLDMGLCSEGTAGVDGLGNSEDRRDFRWSTRVFSIDPASARDVDDALSVQWDSTEQCYRVGIHIADVSHFVRPGTALDQEAAQRGNTFYLVDHAIPMLPPTLSEGLCSLLPGTDRKTLSMEILLTADGFVKRDPWIGRGLVRSCAKLSYADAQRILSALAPEPRPDTLEADVVVLHRLASRLRQRRLERGALCLGRRQIVLNWVADGDHEHHVQIEPRDEAHWLVEEFMLLANESIARFLTRHCPENALLRRHPAFDETQLQRIAEWAQKRRYTFDVGDTKAIQTSLDALASSAPAAFYAVRNRLAKAMANAEYVCAADFEDPVAYRHTALDLDVYTHFTSPIRRYADLVVHRQVLLALDSIPDDTLRLQTRAARNAQTISAISGHCNQRKRDAEAAQTAATWLHLALEFYDKPREYNAIITGFVNRHQALQLYIPSLDLEVILDIAQDLGAVVRRQAESTSTGLEELELYWSPSVLAPDPSGQSPAGAHCEASQHRPVPDGRADTRRRW